MLDATWWAVVLGSAIGAFCGVIATMLILNWIGKVTGWEEEYTANYLDVDGWHHLLTTKDPSTRRKEEPHA